ncbi:MAG: FKBP-type peptidyl-prolyl cis-trans isomerase [Chromatiales bacterium]|jgi:FKBP-type peptidyl-prolyl cis-trans isomerase SlpA
MAEEAEIMRGSRVTMHFSLALFDGKEAISTFDEEPATLTIGEGAMVPTLEMAIYGLKAGDEHTFELTPEQAYGPRDEKLVQLIPLSEFPEEIEPQRGQIIAFTDEDGTEIPGTVMLVEKEQVRVDFNHPLAGNNVIFRVRILSVNNDSGMDL